MAACCSAFECAADQQFNEKKATEELKRYRTKGPGPTTRLLQQGLEHAGTLNGTLLDIGSGIGSLTFGLLERGITHAVAVDASSAYNAVARQEAARLGRADAVRFVHADFVSVAPELPAATVVTLDRVVCCYPSYESAPERGTRPRGTVSCTVFSTRCLVCATRSYAGKRAPSPDEEPIPHLRPSSGADGRTDSVCRVRAVHAAGDVDVVGRRVHAESKMK